LRVVDVAVHQRRDDGRPIIRGKIESVTFALDASAHRSGVHALGVRAGESEARRVTYPPLDTLGFIAYVAWFVAVAALTLRRPAYGACALIAVIPFAFYQELAGTTIRLPKVAVIALILGLWAYPGAFAAVWRSDARRMFVAGVAVIAATALSFAAAAHHAPVVREVLKAVEYVLIFAGIATAYRLDPDARAFRMTFLATASAVALLALVQEITGAPSALLVNGHVIARIAGPLEGPNQLAGYLDVALPLALALTLEERDLLATFTLALAVAADVLTFSRGGMIGAVAGIVTVAVVRGSVVRAALMPLAGGLAAAFGICAHDAVVSGDYNVFSWWTSDVSYAGGVGNRGQLWRAAWTLWRAHPLFGVGAGNFELEIAQTGVRGVRTHANSLYLQALVEGGIPLFAATLWMVYASIATFVRDRARSPFVLAALAGGIALSLHQVVDYLIFFPKVGAQWWAVMAVACASL
jgi:O-antigen ligase